MWRAAGQKLLVMAIPIVYFHSASMSVAILDKVSMSVAILATRMPPQKTRAPLLGRKVLHRTMVLGVGRILRGHASVRERELLSSWCPGIGGRRPTQCRRQRSACWSR